MRRPFGACPSSYKNTLNTHHNPARKLWVDCKSFGVDVHLVTLLIVIHDTYLSTEQIKDGRNTVHLNFAYFANVSCTYIRIICYFRNQ